MGYLGLQNANRTRRPKSKTPGGWTGSITLLLQNVSLFLTVSERNWGRAEEIICDMLEKFNESDHFPEMDLKDGRGFGAPGYGLSLDHAIY